MEDNKITIRLDDVSLDTLKKVNALHRESLVNLGIALVKQTGYYKTLLGESKPLEEVLSLSIESLDSDSKPAKVTKQEETKKQKVSFDF